MGSDHRDRTRRRSWSAARLFDFTNGWNGNHPLGLPVVVRHPPRARGLGARRRRAVHVRHRAASRRRSPRRRRSPATRSVARERRRRSPASALDAGLLDEVWVDLVPVILGGGVPYVRTLGDGPLVLDGPLESTQGNRVTHLRYAVRK